MELDRVLTNLTNNVVRLVAESQQVLKIMPGMAEAMVAHDYLEATLVSLRLAQDHIRVFKAKNKRRLELIEKQNACFSEEEKLIAFEITPGWYEESERRRDAALTENEHAELADLQRWTSEFLTALTPQTFRDKVGSGREVKGAEDAVQTLRSILPEIPIGEG